MPPPAASLRREPFCYLTTTGRASGLPREVEMWFDVHESTLYMLSGGRERAHWVRNLIRRSRVAVRIAGHEFEGEAQVLEAGSDEDALARRLLVEKYRTGAEDLADWGRTALSVAVRLEAPPSARAPSPENLT